MYGVKGKVTRTKTKYTIHRGINFSLNNAALILLFSNLIMTAIGNYNIEKVFGTNYYKNNHSLDERRHYSVGT